MHENHNLCKKICYNLIFVEKVVAATTVLPTIDQNWDKCTL